MFFLKLSLLTLLIAASGSVISAENVITCYGDVQRLQCDTGVIRVKSAIYGRTNPTTCIAGRPPSQYLNTNCAMNVFQISARCNRQQACEYKTDLLGSPDPCFGTYKYYNTTYECVDSMLIAAEGSVISAENAITCYGHVQRLQCDTGVIRVKSAIYGRTNPTTCIAGRPPSQYQNTNCALSISQISMGCDGQQACEYKTDLLGSPDPCFGTYKYYNTTYECVRGNFPADASVACEDSLSTLDCGNDLIKIISANYGRTDGTTCSASLPREQTVNTNCYAPNTLTTVAGWCNEKNKCTVHASYTIFTDPCFGTYKYLRVLYSCVPQATKTSETCEGNNAVLKCESGVLKIQKANYGRTDSITCTAGRPNNQISNTDCYTNKALDEVNTRCEGKTECTVPATNNVFSDPCVGTYKYLRIVYSCGI